MIYLDNAATSFPKPACVEKAAVEAVTAPLGNPGRSSHPLSKKSAEIVYGARETLALLVGSLRPENIVLTSGATAALNLALIGTAEAFWRKGVRPLVATSVFEHNSVLRPLFSLEKKGLCDLEILSPDGTGSLPLYTLRRAPQIVAVTAKSNVTGREFPLKSLSREAKRLGAVVIVDAAQGFGDGDVTFASTDADILCGAGHKGLFGLMGAGFLAVSETCPVLPEAVFFGGSGSDSFRKEMPALLPERLEAGTLPVPAVAAMDRGARFFLKEKGEILYRKRNLKKRLTEGLLSLKDYVVYEPEFPSGPLLINHRTHSPEELENILMQNGIFARQGFHCAPLAHRFLGTEARGALRFSPGPFNTIGEMDRVLAVLCTVGT